MKKIQLKDLKLSIPEISIMESRQLMGGMAGYLAELVVIGNPNGQTDEDRDDHEPDKKPNYPEHDDHDNNIQNDDTQHGDNDQSNNYETNKNNNLIKSFENLTSQPQVGNACVFSAMAAIAEYFGKTYDSGWLKFAADYMDKYSPNAQGGLFQFINIFDGCDFDGLSYLIDSNFVSSLISSEEFIEDVQSSLSKNNPVFGFLINGQDEDGTFDLHAIVIIDYDTETGLYKYWDPETGKIGSTSDDDIWTNGWSVSGLKP